MDPRADVVPAGFIYGMMGSMAAGAAMWAALIALAW